MLVAGASPAVRRRLAAARWPPRYITWSTIIFTFHNLQRSPEILISCCSTMIAVATPKQIREVMKVDGLTNDEVKSHLQVSKHPSFYFSNHFLKQISSRFLIHSFHYSISCLLILILIMSCKYFQKYRLHNRKSPGTASASHSIVLVGDLWASQEVSCSQSGSPQGPLQLSGSGVAVSAATAGDSCCEDDDKSEGYVRK